MLATVIVARGPRAVGHADRIAVPLMVIAGSVLTWAAFTLPARVDLASAEAPPPLLWGIDVVIGYQVSWLLMFADYSRYTRSARAGATAVFAGLALPALWLMPVGWNLARIAGSDDPGHDAGGRGRRLVGGAARRAGDRDDQLREHLPVVAGVAHAGAAVHRRRVGLGDWADRHRRSA